MAGVILTGMACLVLTQVSADAGTITYVLEGDNCSGTCGTAPFLSVTLTENGANLDFVIQLENATKFVKTGGGVLDTNTFMFNATGVALADISGGDLLSHTPTLIAVNTPFTKDPMGTFGFGIRSNGGNGAAAGWSDNITFTVTGAGIADIVANAKGNLFAADVLGDNGNTGAVYGGTAAVPDGGTTFQLLSAAALALGALRRRFKA